MTSVVQSRRNLYLSLFEHIWHPERIGLPVALPPDHDDKPADHARRPPPRNKPVAGRGRTDIARMAAALVLTPGTRIVLTYRATDHWATIEEGGGIVLTATGGTPYGRADEAGAVARGTKRCTVSPAPSGKAWPRGSGVWLSPAQAPLSASSQRGLQQRRTSIRLRNSRHARPPPEAAPACCWVGLGFSCGSPVRGGSGLTKMRA
ncbi:hypothetical protein [Streptomyces chartreusis]